MVKSADRTLFVLEIIADSATGLTHSNIAEALNIPKSSLSSLLANLVERNYITLNPDSKRYTLGSMILYLAGRFLSRMDLVQIGIPIINDLVTQTNESSGITIKIGSEVLSIYNKNSTQTILHSMFVGDRAPVYATAAGRAILAFLSKEEIDQYIASTELKCITENTVCDPDSLTRELEIIRSTGIAYDRQGLFEDTVAIAAPVFNMSGNPVVSVRVALPIMRCNPETESKIEAAVREASRNFSEKLGFKASSKDSLAS